ncbi:MAG: cytochrome c oxidase subunit II [Phycisphaerae bacterium]
MNMTKYRPLILAAVAAALLVCVASAHAWQVTPDIGDKDVTGTYGAGMPPDISRDGHRVDGLIDVLHWFMGILFVGWGIFFVYCLARFRQRPGQAASSNPIKAKPAKYAEVLVAAFEAVLLLGFSVPIWASVRNEIPPPGDNPIHIRVIAEQFQWNFHYPGVDGVFGKTSPDEIDPALNPVGIVADSEGGADDLQTLELHIPVGRPVICEISSKDVIHSFFIPVMRVKQDAIPGMRIPVWFEARPGTEGTYEVACAQLCGNNHYSMKAYMVVQSQAAYDAWLAERAAAATEEFDEDELDD